jgi:hypothetical protein
MRIKQGRKSYLGARRVLIIQIGMFFFCLGGWKLDEAVIDNLQIRTTHIRNHTEPEIKIEVRGQIQRRTWLLEERNTVHITSASHNAE